MLSFVMIGDRCCIGKQVPWFSRNSRMLDVESIHKLPYHVFGCTIKPSNLRFAHSYWGSARKNWMSNVLWRTYTMPVSLEESSSEQPEDYSDDEGSSSEDLPEEPLDQSLSSDEVSSHFHFCLVKYDNISYRVLKQQTGMEQLAFSSNRDLLFLYP